MPASLFAYPVELDLTIRTPWQRGAGRPWLHGRVTQPDQPTPSGPVRVRTIDLPLLLVAAAGLATAVAGAWRVGLVLAGGTLALAGVLRLTLPPVRLGVLVVRARTFDALTLVAVGVALVALALGLPGG